MSDAAADLRQVAFGIGQSYPISADVCRAAADLIENLQERIALLEARIKELEAVAEKYRELLYQVACKFPNETRHETALRYLKERETPAMTADQCCEALLGGGG